MSRDDTVRVRCDGAGCKAAEWAEPGCGVPHWTQLDVMPCDKRGLTNGRGGLLDLCEKCAAKLAKVVK